jgi:hypothetical protein
VKIFLFLILPFKLLPLHFLNGGGGPYFTHDQGFNWSEEKVLLRELIIPWMKIWSFENKPNFCRIIIIAMEYIKQSLVINPETR